MSHVQLCYNLICDEKKLKLNLPKIYSASQYIKRSLYFDDRNNPTFQNSIINVVNNRSDLRKFLLATSDYGRNIQENINSVATDGRFNNTVVRHLPDKRNKGDDVQNPVIGNILSHVNANQLTDAQVTNY